MTNIQTYQSIAIGLLTVITLVLSFYVFNAYKSMSEMVTVINNQGQVIQAILELPPIKEYVR